MSEIAMMILVFVAGIALGILFFAGLWYTVKKLVSAKETAIWFLGSFSLRIGITLTAFYFIGAGNWQRLLVCLLGFVVARFAVVHYTKGVDEKKGMQLKNKNLHGA